MKILVAVPFENETLIIITLTKLFDAQLNNVFESYSFNAKFWKILDIFIFQFSLCFQSYYWLFK